MSQSNPVPEGITATDVADTDSGIIKKQAKKS